MGFIRLIIHPHLDEARMLWPDTSYVDVDAYNNEGLSDEMTGQRFEDKPLKCQNLMLLGQGTPLRELRAHRSS